MQSIYVLYWAISIIFCLSLSFAILLWCRAWRKEDRDETKNHIRSLTDSVNQLITSVETLNHASASLQIADEQMTQQLDDLRGIVKLFHAKFLPPSGQTPINLKQSSPISSLPLDSESESKIPSPKQEEHYAQARALLLDGQSPLKVAKKLDLGTAEVQTIARIIDLKNRSETRGFQADQQQDE